MITFSAFTTLHRSGYEDYGYKNISSFLDYWPNDIKYFVYTEDFSIKQNYKIKNINLKNLNDLNKFKSKNKNISKLNGYKNTKYDFLYDFVKFAHKSYVMFHAIENLTTDWVIWLDGDSITHTKIPFKFLEKLCPSNSFVTYLGRKKMYTETGFLAFNRRHPKILEYVKQAKNIYDNNLIENNSYFNEGYTDCHVFDFVRLQLEKIGVKSNNIGTNGDDKHPFINGELGKYMDHLKGPRKDRGSSKLIDLKNGSHKLHPYWQAIK